MSTITKAANAHTTVTTGWTNPSNAFATTGDNTYATAVSVQNGTVNGDFGFPDFSTTDIPAGSTINSVTVTVEWGMTASVTGGTLGVQLRNNGTNLGTETTKTTTTEAQSTQQVTTGISLSDLRSASTLIKARTRTSKGNVATAMTGNLDFIMLTVDFTPPPNHYPKQVVDEARRSYHNRLRTGGQILIQGNQSWPPTFGTEGVTLPLITFALQGSVANAGVSSPAIHIFSPKPHSKFGGSIQLMGLAPVPTSGVIATTLPLLSFALTGTGPIVSTAPTRPIHQVNRLSARLISGGFIQLGHLSAQQPATVSLTLALPLLTFSSAGTVRGDDLVATLPKLTFGIIAALEEAVPQALTFVQKPALPKFKGFVKLLRPARQPQALGTGALSFTVPKITFAASSTISITGTIGLSLPLLQWSSSTNVNITGSAAFTLPKITFVASSTSGITATLGLTIPLLQFNLSEGAGTLSQITLVLPRLLWQSSGEVRDLDGSLLGSGPTSGQLFPR